MTQIAQRDPPTLKVLRQHRFALHVDQIAMQLDVIVRSRAHERADGLADEGAYGVADEGTYG